MGFRVINNQCLEVNTVTKSKRRRFPNGYWLHIILNVLTIVIGFSTFLPLSYVTSYFQGKCLLYAKVRLLESNGNIINVDSQESLWGQPSDCEIPIYFAVMSTIHAFVWCWFFLMLIWQPSNEDLEIFILDVSFVFHLITCLMLLISSGKLSGGTRYWCDQLTNELEATGLSQNISTCAGTENVLWDKFERKHSYYTFLITSNICSWLLAISVLLQSYLCAYRLYNWNENSPRSLTRSKTYVGYYNDIDLDEL